MVSLPLLGSNMTRRNRRLVLKFAKKYWNVYTNVIKENLSKDSRLSTYLAVDSSQSRHHYSSILYSDGGAPKGFEKYFPNGDKKNTKTNSSSNKADSGEKRKPFEFELKFGGSKKSSGGSSGGGDGKEGPTDQQKAATLFTLGLAVVLGLSFFNERYQEINWRDFVNEYLSKNNVERLEVVNKKWVRVIAKNPGIKIPWFTIGSVDVFDRNLEAVQLEQNVESINFLPVTYKDEMDSTTLTNAFLWVAPLAFIFFLMRRGMSGMVGAMGGAGRPGASGKGGMFGFGQSTARILKENTGVTFK
jgi:AFG3 family protein